jgi:hypothetical protein
MLEYLGNVQEMKVLLLINTSSQGVCVLPDVLIYP